MRERLGILPVMLFLLYVISNNNLSSVLVKHKLAVADAAPGHTMPMRGNLGIIRGGLNPHSFTAGRLTSFMAF